MKDDTFSNDDRTIVQQLATRVMGWKPIDRRAYGWGDGPEVWATGDEDNPSRQFWNPLERIADAWMLVERMRELIPKQKETQTFSFQLCQTGIPGGWFCSFVVNDLDWSHQASVDEANSAPRAICLAALRAIGGWG